MSGNSNPIAAVAARFGGGTAMARACGYPQQTIQWWITNARVPSQNIPVVIARAAKLDPPIILEPNDFFAAIESVGSSA